MADVASPSPGEAPTIIPARDSPTEDNTPDPTSEDTSTAVTKANGTDGAITITTNAEGKRVKKIIRKKRRPARPQVDPATFKSEPPPQTGTIFNIWYNKWSGGDREDKYLSKTAAPSRCSVAKDSGYTRADSNPGSYFCLFFARGLCPKGRDCEYLHRLPTTYDIYSGNVDCFGRDKHSDYRDDMGGVGSFMRQNRTLYVGRIHPTPDIEEVVARHFAEWGNIERTRVLPTRGVAFVTYTTEALAQFAKEAMAHQALDNEEVLNVRWATVDPNPASQKREAKMIEEQAADAIRRALPEAFVREIEGDQDAKRRRLDEGKFGLEGYKASDEVWFEAEKARMAAADDRGVEAPAEMLMIEQPSHEQQQRQGIGGLLGSSTLAALKGYTPGTALGMAKAAKGVGPLVGYGSDDDSD
ncbi:hypothetical protein FH972_023681 [Carpinus fangiana]|uniref:C3H1-type domain-containing protein n=1 Tax=Carpinus fangiana TaxID=176857 RepID=A0A5N6KW97_9ROSI|nr:hypothetical protein FH972_023681 [Carpinus fangiana]